LIRFAILKGNFVKRGISGHHFGFWQKKKRGISADRETEVP